MVLRTLPLLTKVSPQTHKKLTKLGDAMTMSLHGLSLLQKGSASLFWTGFWTLASGKAKKDMFK